MPYAHRERSLLPRGWAEPPAWVTGQLRVRRDHQQGSGTARSTPAGCRFRDQQGQLHLTGRLLPFPFSPMIQKNTARGEKHFSPQESCEIFLKVSSSKWHFWSNQLLGASILLEESNCTCDTDTARVQCNAKEI